MYSQQELDDAVASGVISADAADALRAHVERQRSTAIPDEEQFRLITGFNDIFVSIAAAILLFAVGWIGQSIGQSTGLVIDVRRPLSARSACGCSDRVGPRAVLHRASAGWRFLRSCCCWPSSAACSRPSAFALIRSHRRRPIRTTTTLLGGIVGAASAAVAAGAAWLHWRRFHVPITVAAGAAAVAGDRRSACCSPALGQNIEQAKNLILGFVLLLGIGVFLFAMWWDASDRARLTRRSDVAFWLHLLAAPMIVAPDLHAARPQQRARSVGEGLVVVALYVALGLTALAVDRRALLVSALAYVLFALDELFQRVRRGRAQRRADGAGHRLGAAAAVGLLAPGARS